MNRRESLKLGAAIVAGMAMTPSLPALEPAMGGRATDSFWEVIKNRRSVRQFKPDPVPEEHLLKIVDAARMAPCAGNEQPWKFIIVQDKKLIEALKKEVGPQVAGRLSAPAYIVVLTDGQRMYPDYNQHDGPLAAGYLLLAARALGYGTVYMTDSIPAEVTKRVLNIPDRYHQVCVTPVGVPVEWPTKDKKALDDFVVRERFQ